MRIILKPLGATVVLLAVIALRIYLKIGEFACHALRNHRIAQASFKFAR